MSQHQLFSEKLGLSDFHVLVVNNIMTLVLSFPLPAFMVCMKKMTAICCGSRLLLNSCLYDSVKNAKSFGLACLLVSQFLQVYF